jgi:EAL and modified HD-GYP domain-containing signal transduction protein
LLRYVNSAFFALPWTVSSVREALTLLGVRTVRRWAVVMAVSALPDVHDELVLARPGRAYARCSAIA